MSARGLCAPALALALGALVLSGCETTAEKSAKLERQAKRVTLQQEKGLTVARESTTIAVVGTALLRGPERAAAVVTLKNRSAHAQREVPIAITIKDIRGRTLFENDEPGLERALVSIPSIPPHASVVWIDDQVPASGRPASVSARVGQAPALAGQLPELAVAEAKLSEDPASGTVAEGTVANRSKVAQSGLVLFALARRAGKIVAAGRAVVPELAPGASAPFQASLVGDAHGAGVQVLAPPASFG
ncbi:MAG TPA: hypothetical protein VLJ80_10385 [Solirubrobacteraceae bacterium]|nr:hypothetical protein [Solirubrobacteraceae bacterium]